MVVRFNPWVTRLAALAAASSLLAGAATAQSFIFSSTSSEPVTMGATTAQGSVTGAYWTGESTVTFADGSAAASTFKCVSTSQPPRDSIFMAHGVCDGSGEDGDYTVYSGCNFLTPDGSEMGCVGGLIGKTGTYEGRSGSLTIHTKGGVSTGTGQWYQ